MRKMGRILDWDAWPTLPCEELTNMVNLIRAGVCPQEDEFTPETDVEVDGLDVYENGAKIETEGETQRDEEENREDSGFVEGHDFQEKQEAADQAQPVIGASGFDSLLDLYLELPAGGNIPTNIRFDCHNEHGSCKEGKEAKIPTSPVIPAYENSLHLPLSQVSLSSGLRSSSIFSNRDCNIVVVPGFETDRLQPQAGRVLKQVVTTEPLIHATGSTEYLPSFKNWKRADQEIGRNQPLRRTNHHIPDGVSPLRHDLFAASSEDCIIEVRQKNVETTRSEKEFKEERPKLSYAGIPDVCVRPDQIGLLTQDSLAPGSNDGISKMSEQSLLIRHKNYISMCASLGLSAFLRRWDNDHVVLPLKIGEFYDEDGFLAIVPAQKKEAAFAKLSQECNYHDCQAAGNKAKKHLFGPITSHCQPEPVSILIKSPVEMPQDGTKRTQDNNNNDNDALGQKLKLAFVDTSLFQDQMRRSKAVKETTNRVEQVGLHRQSSTFSWNSVVIEQSAELATVIANAYNEHRESIEQNRSVRGIPGDLLEPHATMMQLAAESLAFPHPIPQTRNFYNISLDMIAQRNLEKGWRMVDSMAEAEKMYTDWPVHTSRRMELPLFGFAFSRNDFVGEAEQMMEAAEPTLTPSLSVCSFGYITRLDSGEDNAIRSGVSFADEKAEGKVVGEDDIRRELRWHWPFGHVKRTSISKNLRTDRKEYVKKQTFWWWKPKSQRKKLSKRPPLEALPAEWM